MSRDGFTIADIDTTLMSDPKVVALARRHRDPLKTAAAVAPYVGLLLASWRAGKRLTLEESAPAWFIDHLDLWADDLAAVGLIDGERRAHEHAWRSWFVPADTRREDKRERDRAYAASRRQRVVNDSKESRPTVVPTDRSDRPDPTEPSEPSICSVGSGIEQARRPNAPGEPRALKEWNDAMAADT
jgi:hypothetical protein